MPRSYIEIPKGQGDQILLQCVKQRKGPGEEYLFTFENFLFLITKLSSQF